MTDRLTAKDVIELWKTAINVEMHFNTVEMTVRNIFAGIVVALIAGVGYSLKEKISITFGISLAPILCCAAIFITALFYFVDRYWYHRLLIGSVIEATRLEAELSKFSDIEIKLSKQISDVSPIELRNWVTCCLRPFLWEKKFRETGKLHSDAKIELFYKSVMLMFVALAIATLFATPTTTEAKPQPNYAHPLTPP